MSAQADPIVVGISALFHDAACCLLRGGRLIAAAEEERFSRIKHDPSMPVRAFEYCLRQAGVCIEEIDCVSYYELPEKKAARQLWSAPARALDRGAIDPGRPEREIREALRYEGPLDFVGHHLSHAASSFYYSGFDEAAILTVDGVGEWDSTAYGRGTADEVVLFETVEYPDSLGLLYSAITAYLGFEVNEGEYKVMGLAPYGRPLLEQRLGELVTSGPGGQYRLALEYFAFAGGERMYSEALEELLGAPARRPGAELEPFHADVACSLQRVLERILLEKASYLAQKVPSENLCLAGGVALNCVANGRLLREGPFRRLFVQPAAGDSGGCLGAAAVSHRRLTGDRIPVRSLASVRLGPSYRSEEVAELLGGTSARYQDFRGEEDRLIEAVAERLAAGQIVGWFQGRMELGPRALGARSILADPRDPRMQEKINALIKQREAFRPFAPAVLRSAAAEHFDLTGESPFMLLTCQVRSPLSLPAVTHVDGSARVQTVDPTEAPRFAALLAAFARRTGCPILLNTSFNVRGEPIVCTPADALTCFVRARLDALAIEDLLLDRGGIPDAWGHFVERTRPPPSGIRHAVYTLW